MLATTLTHVSDIPLSLRVWGGAGALPPELGQLGVLEYLTLQDNGITGTPLYGVSCGKSSCYPGVAGVPYCVAPLIFPVAFGVNVLSRLAAACQRTSNAFRSTMSLV